MNGRPLAHRNRPGLVPKPRNKRNTNGAGDSFVTDPLAQIKRMRATMEESLDPAKAPSKVRTLAEMTPEERAEMARLYGGKR